MELGKLEFNEIGVQQVNSDEKNIAVILLAYQKEPQVTLSRTTFLCLCWNRSLQHRARARYYLETLKSFIHSSQDRQQRALEKAKQILEGSANLNGASILT